jgi:FAD/FMN-containing dehydrogenase
MSFQQIAAGTFAETAAELKTRLDGDFALPGDEQWDEARQAWNLAVNQEPAAVALPESAADVQAVVDFAREQGLRIAPQGTGYNAGGLSAHGPLSDAILLKTSRMRGVEIDPENRRARAEAGVLWLEVVTAAAEHGLAALSGSSPDVGVVGYTLGGGLSWLSRKYGTAANNVTAVEIVTADGELRRVDAENDPELFWALRGGGGAFGAVTAIEFKLHPLSEVYAGMLFFPVERASEVLKAWHEWSEDLPDELTSVGRILHLPPIPDIPEPMRGKSFVVVEVIHLGNEEEGFRLIQPMRELGPVADTVRQIPIVELPHVHMDPEHPVPGAGDGMVLDAFTDAAIDALVERSGQAGKSALLSIEVRRLGGEIARRREGNGALDAIDAPFIMFAVGIAMTPEMKAAVKAEVEDVKAILSSCESESMYLNFAEERRSPKSLWGEFNAARLAAVKDRVDPTDVFRSNHPVR